MRTNIDIDDELLAAARAVAGTVTKRQTVEVALRELVDRDRRAKILRLRGRVRWEGDLEASRAGRALPADAPRRPRHEMASPDGPATAPRPQHRHDGPAAMPPGTAASRVRQHR
jgi:Arc/MetJ family transcription regulator